MKSASGLSILYASATIPTSDKAVVNEGIENYSKLPLQVLTRLIRQSKQQCHTRKPHPTTPQGKTTTWQASALTYNADPETAPADPPAQFQAR